MSSPDKIFAGNWKMNFGPSEAVKFFNEIKTALEKTPQPGNCHRVIFPVAYALGTDVQHAASSAGFKLGAQNTHWEEKGAFTGELSASTLKSIGVEWALVAHSERRQFFGETDETAAKRLARAISAGLNVIYCVGETLAQRENEKTFEVLEKQIGAFSKTVTPLGSIGTVISIAYEPVWAIGTGKTATPEQAQEAHAFIRKQIASIPNAGKIPLLYGGSVTPANSKVLLSQKDVDGVLVGGASLKPQDFALILS